MESIQSNYFAQLPAEVLLSKNLTCFQKLLYADIHSLCNQKGYCYAKNEFLAKRHGKHKRYISEQITVLLKKQFLFSLERPTGRFNKSERRLFTEATFLQYAKAKGLDITGVFNSQENLTVKSQENLTVLNKSNTKKKSNKRSIKNNTSKESGDSYKQRLEKKLGRKIAPIVKKDLIPDPLKSKYFHTTEDFRNYSELKAAGATNHRKNTKAEIATLDKLHALFSDKCKSPYHMVDVPDKYKTIQWDMDDLLEVFTFQLKNAARFNMKPIRSIGNFILQEGFGGNKSWSPLVYWHQKMHKTAAGELSECGKRLLSSMKRAKIGNLKNLDSSILNKVAKDLFAISDKYVFMDGKEITMEYPFGVVDVLSKYIKEKCNNLKFKLVYITKNGFVDEFLDEAKSRNIIMKKSNGRSLYI